MTKTKETNELMANEILALSSETPLHSNRHKGSGKANARWHFVSVAIKSNDSDHRDGVETLTGELHTSQPMRQSISLVRIVP